MATVPYQVPPEYTDNPNATDPANPFTVTPVANVITIPSGQVAADVTITAAGTPEYTLANPTDLVEGFRYVVRITVGHADAIGSTLAFGNAWVAQAAGATNLSTFDASANGDVNIIEGVCIGQKIYYTILNVSAD